MSVVPTISSITHEVVLVLRDAPTVDVPKRYNAEKGYTIESRTATVSAYSFDGRPYQFSVTVEGRVIRRSDGEVVHMVRRAFWRMGEEPKMPVWLEEATYEALATLRRMVQS